MAPAPSRHRLVTVSDPLVGVMGRVDRSESDSLRVGYPGVTLRVTFEGPRVAWRASCATSDCRVVVVTDGKPAKVIRLLQGEAEYVLAEGLAPGVHTVDVVQRTETWQGIVTVRGFVFPAEARVLAPAAWPDRRLLFIGDSVTCGEGVDRASLQPGEQSSGADAYGSYGMLIARALGAQCHLVCYGGRGLVRDWQGRGDSLNAPQFFHLALPEETAPVVWDHREYAPDLVFVSLGTNDFNAELGAPPARQVFVGAYVEFLRVIRATYPRAKVVLTEGAIVKDESHGEKRKSLLRAYIAEVVEILAAPEVVFIPSTYYPGDLADAHPTGEEHVKMAEDFVPDLARLLGW